MAKQPTSRAIKRRRYKTFSPWCQGELDGLCGIYAVINAFRCLCPEIDETCSRKLFKVMVRSIIDEPQRDYATIWGGISWAALEPAAQKARRYVCDEFSIKLTFSRPQDDWRSPRLDENWQCLTEAAMRDAVTILALGVNRRRGLTLWRPATSMDYDTDRHSDPSPICTSIPISKSAWKSAALCRMSHRSANIPDGTRQRECL